MLLLNRLFPYAQLHLNSSSFTGKISAVEHISMVANENGNKNRLISLVLNRVNILISNHIPLQ